MQEHPDSLWQPFPEEVRALGKRPVPLSPAACRRPAWPARRLDRAVEILEERFARGEIGRGELEERRAALRGSMG